MHLPRRPRRSQRNHQLRELRVLCGSHNAKNKQKSVNMKQSIQFEELSEQVMGCAIEVHRELGSGLLESAYEQCLAHELRLQGIAFEIQKPMPVDDKGVLIDCGYRLDLLVDENDHRGTESGRRHRAHPRSANPYLLETGKDQNRLVDQFQRWPAERRHRTICFVRLYQHEEHEGHEELLAECSSFLLRDVRALRG